jgi:release factor glutamine methyltransferase
VRPARSPTIEQARLEQAVRRLRDAGIAEPEAEALKLADHASRAGSDGKAGPAEESATFDKLLAARCARIPAERVLGRTRFRQVELLVAPGVFLPQPETGVVVQWAVDALSHLIDAGVAHPRCIDLCTGSGTIAVSLAHEVPAAEVHAVELDPAALALAGKNAEHNDALVTLHHADVAHAVPGGDRAFDLVASNPPYVAAGELLHVHPEARDHDPHTALLGGDDGLELVRAVEQTARRLLRSGGSVVVEHSDRQGIAAPDVFRCSDAWHSVADHCDDDGLDRFVTAVKR